MSKAVSVELPVLARMYGELTPGARHDPPTYGWEPPTELVPPRQAPRIAGASSGRAQKDST